MADVFSKAKRSEVMSRIRGSANKDTEIAFTRFLRAHRISGWRRKQAIFGKPDFVFPKLRLAIFIDGCFWHGCPKHGTQPKNNAVFWSGKLDGNRIRDRRVNRTLRTNGWFVVRIWEHELSKRNHRSLLRKMRRSLSRASDEMKRDSAALKASETPRSGMP